LRKFSEYAESEWVPFGKESKLPSSSSFLWTASAPRVQLKSKDVASCMRKVRSDLSRLPMLLCAQCLLSQRHKPCAVHRAAYTTGHRTLTVLTPRSLQVCYQSTRTMKTEEVQRCVFAQQGAGYVVDCTVRCTAPYGEYWRTVCRFTCAAHPAAAANGAAQRNGKHRAASQLRINYRMCYARPVSGWMRHIIEPAAESGLAKNFAQFIDVLSGFTKLSDASKATELPGMADTVSGASLPSEPIGGAAGVTERPTESKVVLLLTAMGARRRIRSVRTVFVDDHLLNLFLPAANVLLASVGAAAPESGGGVRAVAAMLSTLLVASLLQGVLSVWHWAGGLCGRSHNTMARACQRVYHVIDLPRSVTGLVVAISVILLMRSMLGGWAKVRNPPINLAGAAQGALTSRQFPRRHAALFSRRLDTWL
jgi:hypothetical protein